jgi:class 3 adenylate cyclase
MDKFFYDVWGDAVNVASRIESTSVPGRIQISGEVYERLKDDFSFESRGRRYQRKRRNGDVVLNWPQSIGCPCRSGGHGLNLMAAVRLTQNSGL